MKEKYIDFQIHSIYSDGVLTPQDLVARAEKEKISIISLTDHNCLDGVQEAASAGKKRGVGVVSGIELYTKFKRKSIHLLGYNFDIKNKKLEKILKELQQERVKWVEGVLKKSAKIGFQIESEKIFNTKSKYIGFGHIIYILRQNSKNEALIRKITKQKEPDLFKIIEKFFMKGGPAYVPEKEIPTEGAIKLIKSAGGISAIAHPGQNLRFEDDYLIKGLKKKGLDAIEVINPHHSWQQVIHYQKLALDLNLLISGGSDFHGDIEDPRVVIKNQRDYFKIPYSTVKKICQKINV